MLMWLLSGLQYVGAEESLLYWGFIGASFPHPIEKCFWLVGLFSCVPAQCLKKL